MFEMLDISVQKSFITLEKPLKQIWIDDFILPPSGYRLINQFVNSVDRNHPLLVTCLYLLLF